MEKQLIAMGGGGFSMEPANPLLDLYIRRQCSKPTAKACLIPTASRDHTSFSDTFHLCWEALDTETTTLGMAEMANTERVREKLLSQDIIYITGGHTSFMLQAWKKHGIDLVLREAWEQGIILAGVSAGAVCWFEQGITDSAGQDGPEPEPLLNLLPGAYCAHFDLAGRQEVFEDSLAQWGIQGYGVPNFVGLHFKDSTLHRVVASRPRHHAYLYTSTTESKLLPAEEL